ncbi:MAG: hypothetical protein K5675_10045 [Lachnospiraceae bacterium]|nr:hypothetical protein [Lachnospiraceae bacterium]
MKRVISVILALIITIGTCQTNIMEVEAKTNSEYSVTFELSSVKHSMSMGGSVVASKTFLDVSGIHVKGYSNKKYSKYAVYMDGYKFKVKKKNIVKHPGNRIIDLTVNYGDYWKQETADGMGNYTFPGNLVISEKKHSVVVKGYSGKKWKTLYKKSLQPNKNKFYGYETFMWDETNMEKVVKGIVAKGDVSGDLSKYSRKIKGNNFTYKPSKVKIVTINKKGKVVSKKTVKLKEKKQFKFKAPMTDCVISKIKDEYGCSYRIEKNKNNTSYYFFYKGKKLVDIQEACTINSTNVYISNNN